MSALALLAWAGRAAFAAELLLTPLSGNAPLTVKVHGPPALLEKVRECRYGVAGIGFYVDWGDHVATPLNREKPDCTKLLEHTYTVPGTYDVKAAVEHPGPTDNLITDWSGGARVEVKGTGTGAFTVKIPKFLPGGAIHFGTGFPPLRVRVETSVPAELVAEIVKSDGSVLFTETKLMKNSDEPFLTFPKYGNGPAAEEFRDGKIRARVRVTLKAEGRVPAVAKSEPFTIFASARFRSFRASSKGLLAEAAYETNRRVCYAYRVDWGDGSVPTTSGPFTARKQCSLEKSEISLTHQYPKPGTYLIRWYDNESDPFHDVATGPGYMEQKIQVRP